MNPAWQHAPATHHGLASIFWRPETTTPCRSACVAVGATELLRGRTVAQNMELLVLSNFAERVVGSR